MQAFATQQIIESYGFETEIIEYHSGSDKGIKFSFAAVYILIKRVFSKFTRKKNTKVQLDSVHTENVKERIEAADSFRKDYLHNFIRCDGISQLRKTAENYYAVLVGSDQVWLPEIAVTNYFTLRFAPVGVKRISYATSMGVSTYPRYVKHQAADYWKKIDYLSVREEQAKSIINSVCDKEVSVVADPTYLLTKEEWLDRIPYESLSYGKYILCYFLGNDDRMKRYAKRYAKIKGLKIVSILSNECDSNDYEYADEIVKGKGPDYFVNLIRNAQYVLTDSFHGVAFSIINEKQFQVFYRKRDDVKESRNSRIDNIVRTWGIEDQLIKNLDSETIVDNWIDYSIVNAKVENFRRESLSFIEKALGV